MTHDCYNVSPIDTEENLRKCQHTKKKSVSHGKLALVQPNFLGYHLELFSHYHL
jgi:hypothetical protein